MAHAVAGFRHQPLRQHLIVSVKGAVEEHERRTLDAGADVVVHACAAGNVEEVLAGSGRGNLESEGVADLGAEARTGVGIFEIERDLAGNGEGFDGQTKVGAAAFSATGSLSGNSSRGTRSAASTLKSELDAIVASTRFDP